MEIVPCGRRRRQLDEDTPGHRRDGRRVRIQLRVALPADQPQKNLLPLTGESFLGNVEGSFKPNVTAGSDAYGVPFGPALGGGVLYNWPVYAKLGLQIPKTWAQFMANNAKIKADQRRP